MSNILNNGKEAPIIMPQGERVEFSFKVSELVNVKRACQALQDFRHCGIENMRRFHANRKLLAGILETLGTEEEVLRDMHMLVYGPESAKLSTEELATRTKEYNVANKKFITEDHIVGLYTIPNSVFEEPLKDEAKFPKKPIDNIEVDTLIAYMDLCSEGIIV